MKAAHLRDRYDAPLRLVLDWSRVWSIIIQRTMRASAVIVGEIAPDDSLAKGA